MGHGFTSEDIAALRQRLARLVQRKSIGAADAQTVLGVFARPVFSDFLAGTDGEDAHRCMAALQSTDPAEALPAFEQLRKLCMGVWLENCSSFAISDEGELQVRCSERGVDFTDDFSRHLATKSDGVTSTYYRQAALRQIERHYLMKANGLFDEDFHPRRIADIGAGTLIASTMMREQAPSAEITAYEPGLVSSKSRAIAARQNIELRPGEFSAGKGEKYDLIMLHFVLEHDIDHAKELIRQSLRALAPGGKISIGVPNYDAFHRAYETEHAIGKRDARTRLSFHRLSGHQIIFTGSQLDELIQQVEREEGMDLPIQTQTILPRPHSFNEILVRSSDNRLLDTLEREGHPADIPEQGSVLAISVGGPSRYRTAISARSSTDPQTAFSQLMQTNAHGRGGAQKSAFTRG